MSGFFISFEGGEGSGKSTQIARLADRLRADGFDVVTTREPGGSTGAEAVRYLVLSGAGKAMGPDMETLLFAAARLDHLECLIRPALRAGHVVICDRFHDSTRAYQGDDTRNASFVDALEQATVGSTLPDLTIILDIPAADGLRRAGQRRGASEADRFEAESVAVHERRRSRFLEIARNERQRCVVVDGSRSIDNVASEVAFIVLDRLDSRRLERGQRTPSTKARS